MHVGPVVVLDEEASLGLSIYASRCAPAANLFEAGKVVDLAYHID
jgi:hypothetical protein